MKALLIVTLVAVLLQLSQMCIEHGRESKGERECMHP